MGLIDTANNLTFVKMKLLIDILQRISTSTNSIKTYISFSMPIISHIRYSKQKVALIFQICLVINISTITLKSKCKFLAVSVVSTNAGSGGGTGASLYFQEKLKPIGTFYHNSFDK